MIDGNLVVAEFIEDDVPVIVGTKPEDWKGCHVRQSQYSLQTVKCTDPKFALAFNHHTLRLFLKGFYHHLYQLFTRLTEMNGKK